jgi:GNAT superfamily N-acetyltransferase
MTAYRDATADDAPAIDGLFKSVFCGTFGHLYRAEDLDAFLAQFTLEAWRTQLTDPAYAVRLAEQDGQAIGYAKLGPMKLPLEEDRPSILLSQLYVDPAHHGQGVAHALMDWAFAEARQRCKEHLYLTVFIDNPRARRFYERFGFEEVGRFDFMVGKQADHDIVTRKRL